MVPLFMKKIKIAQPTFHLAVDPLYCHAEGGRFMDKSETASTSSPPDPQDPAFQEWRRECRRKEWEEVSPDNDDDGMPIIDFGSK